jgi:rhodanese-related sulfurtransferase
MTPKQDPRQIGSALAPAKAGRVDEDPVAVGLCPRELAHLMDTGRVTVIDIREPREVAIRRIAGALNVPESELATSDLLAGEAARVVLCCDSGERSRRVADRQATRGGGGIEYLAGGLDAWAAEGLGLIQGPTPTRW